MNFSKSFLCLIAAAFAMTACSRRKPMNAATIDSLPADTMVLEEFFVPDPPLRDNMPNPLAKPEPEKVFGRVDVQPEFPGGNNALYKFIASNLRMPKQAREAAISGRVFVSFAVEATGEISDIRIVKALGFGCDEEAVRLIKSMPKWKPAREYDKPKRVRYSLPINFNAERMSSDR